MLQIQCCSRFLCRNGFIPYATREFGRNSYTSNRRKPICKGIIRIPDPKQEPVAANAMEDSLNTNSISTKLNVKNKKCNTHGINAILKVGLFKISRESKENDDDSLPGRSAKLERLVSKRLSVRLSAPSFRFRNQEIDLR